MTGDARTAKAEAANAAAPLPVSGSNPNAARHPEIPHHNSAPLVLPTTPPRPNPTPSSNPTSLSTPASIAAHPNSAHNLLAGLSAGLSAAGRRRGRILSRAVGYYQSLLRHCLEHFFPEGVLEEVGDRAFIHWDEGGGPRNACFPEEDGLAINLNWFRSSFRFLPASPIPFLECEKRLVSTIVAILDQRFRAMFDQGDPAGDLDLIRHSVEDAVVSHFVDPRNAPRMIAALDALRVAALTTHENRRLSTGALLLGTDHDPASPQRRKPDGAPRFNARLSAIKSFHRLCDGTRSVFLVDREGDITWPVDIRRWAVRVQGDECADGERPCPCPDPYRKHALATREGGHVCLVLTPHQEIKIFADGAMVFAYSDARWRLLDIPSKYEVWRRAVATVPTRPPNLAARVFRAALNLSEDRHGALFVLLRDPEASLRQLVDPSDRIAPSGAEDPEDPDNLSPRLAKRVLHHLVRGQSLADIDPAVLEALAKVDGAVVTDTEGRLHAFGAILRVSPNTIPSNRAVEGARSTAALAASYHGPVLKVSEDGFLTMFLGGRRIWEI